MASPRFLHSYRNSNEVVCSDSAARTKLYLASFPIPPRNEFTGLKFTIVSHDQGFADDGRHESFTWFEVGLLQPVITGSQPVWEAPEYIQENVVDFSGELETHGWKLVPLQLNNEPRFAVELQRNIVSPGWSVHEIVWDEVRMANDPGAREIMNNLDSDCRIAIWARSQYPGWFNYVQFAGIELILAQHTEICDNWRPVAYCPGFQLENIETSAMFGSRKSCRPTQDLRPNFTELYDLHMQSTPPTILETEAENMTVELQKYLLLLELSRNTCYSRLLVMDDSMMHHQRLYNETKLLEHLNTCILLSKAILQLIPRDHEMTGRYAGVLGINLATSYIHTGERAQLRDAIDYCNQALSFTQQDEFMSQKVLKNLVVLYRFRCEQTRAEEDYQDALNIVIKAYGLGHSMGISHLGALWSLANICESRNASTSDTRALNKAIELFYMVHGELPDENTAKAHFHLCLSRTHLLRYEKTEEEADLQLAATFVELALNHQPPLHDDDRALCLVVKAKALKITSDKAGRIFAILKMAEESVREALRILPSGHPDRFPITDLLIDILEKGSALENINYSEVVSLSTDILNAKDCDPAIRLKRCQQFFDACAGGLRDWTSATKIALNGMVLVNLLLPRTLEPMDRIRQVRLVKTMATDGAAAALQIEDVSAATSLLEAGRRAFSVGLDDLRSDLTEIAARRPELAARFTAAVEVLDYTPASFQAVRDAEGVPVNMWESRSNMRHDAETKLEAILREIRAMPDFYRFLEPPLPEEFEHIAEHGPIVVINVSKYRCDAIIHLDGDIIVKDLPKLRFHDVVERSKNLRLASSQLRIPVDLLDILEWLWNSAARDILDDLGFHKRENTGDVPRIWWILTGPLVQFPIHAAGDYRSESPDSVLDRVMSSYASSLSAIKRGRRRPRSTSNTDKEKRAIVVGMETTPDMSDDGHDGRLDFAMEEVSTVERLFLSNGVNVFEADPERWNVLESMKKSDFFHFAGHGQSSVINPLDSHLRLQDWKKSPLDVKSMMQHNLSLEPPFLAYLSACQTGAIQDDELADQMINLMSGCQLAGFRNVVGTLWEVDDQSCVRICEKFYQVVLGEGMDDWAVCKGLHQAVVALREEWMKKSYFGPSVTTRGLHRDPKEGSITVTTETEARKEPSIQPLLWAPYVLYGV